jgi:hypothetical protein
MWQEFSRHTEIYQTQTFGRHTEMLLTQLVTLHPDSATFSVRYVITNPTAVKQGKKLWNDALFPRFHNQDGIVQGEAAAPANDDAQLIYPFNWISDHWGRDLRPWTEEMNEVSSWTAYHNSMFAWDAQHGFSGVYYPAVDVNRLRITDPATAPAAKLYLQGLEASQHDSKTKHMRNFIEIWGGTDAVFEIPERWINPGCSAELSFHYGMTYNIGRCVYANEHLVIGQRDEQLYLQTWRDTAQLTVRVDDQTITTSSPDPS